MSMKVSAVLAASAVLFGAVVISPKAKADSSTSIDLSATVLDACSFGTVTDITFPTDYEPGQPGTLIGSGSLVINCTVDSQSVTLTPDGCGNPGGSGGRNLVHETDTTELLNYTLLISDADAPTTTNTFTASTPLPQTLAQNDNTFVLDAIIAESQAAIGGDYADSVSILMSF
jgi:spore coat protein U-like protein